MEDVSRQVETFFSNFHRQRLQPLGFRKEPHTFWRDCNDYVERFQFQGSAWNTFDEDWFFYINVGVQWKDKPRRVPDGDFPHAHWWQRVEDVVPTASGQFALRFPVAEEFEMALLNIVLNASNNITQHLATILQDYPLLRGEPLMTPTNHAHRGETQNTRAPRLGGR